MMGLTKQGKGHAMLSPDRFTELLGKACAQLPPEIFGGLNLGIGVSEQVKTREDTASGRSAYILGEYRAGPQMGRGIILYYGSFAKVYPHLEEDSEALSLIDGVLRHELLHHLESQAGARDLEFADARRLMEM